MTTRIQLGDITIHRVVEQEAATFFDAFEFFPSLTKELWEVVERRLAGRDPGERREAAQRVHVYVQAFPVPEEVP